MKNMKESEKQLLIKKIINEYEVAYKEIVAGTLEKIPVGRKKMKKTFSKQNGNWGLTTGKLRKDGTLGDTTTTYRLEKLAALGLFSSEDFQNYAGDLHEDIGYNHHDAKYIMIYLYNRVINRKQNSKDKAPEYDDFGIEELPVKTEGAKRQVVVNQYERSKELRTKFIKLRNGKCVCDVCGFDFEATYGDIGKGFIHVHHNIPLHTIQASYSPNIKKDFALVCPNCHSMIHRDKQNLLTVDKLREIIIQNKKKNS